MKKPTVYPWGGKRNYSILNLRNLHSVFLVVRLTNPEIYGRPETAGRDAFSRTSTVKNKENPEPLLSFPLKAKVLELTTIISSTNYQKTIPKILSIEPS